MIPIRAGDSVYQRCHSIYGIDFKEFCSRDSGITGRSGCYRRGKFVQRLFRVVLPLMKPAIATVCIINFITCLNNFFTPLYYSNDIQVLSVAIVQLPLRDNMYGVPWDLVSAMGWIILLPIIIFVAIFEKQIMDGIMAGGVKA